MVRRARGLAIGLALAIAPLVARADEPRAAPSAEARKEAAQKWNEAMRAFDAGDFRRAGEEFERVYQLAPHEDPLWNAARAWHRAGDLPRAANLYARYLRTAPADARDRAKANAALASLDAKLARIEVHTGAGVEGVLVDDTPLDAPLVYVLPGTHIVRAHSSQGDLEAQKTARAGEAVSVVLALPSTSPPTSPSATASGGSLARPAASAETSTSTSTSTPTSTWRGFSPTVVWVGAGVTLALGGLVVWSGLDTMSTLHAFESTPSQHALDSGRAQEARTNVLLGCAIGMAALTTATAIWLTDWGPAHDVTVGASANGVVVRGGF